jgi:hypothetical protein
MSSATPRIGHLISPQLLAVLDEVFPQTLPDVKDTERQIFLVSGRRQVVNYLRQQHDERFEQAHES